MSVDASELGLRLRQARENRGLSQEAVGREIELPRTAITRIEAGERAVSSLELVRLARLYHIPVSDFFRAPDSVPEDYLVTLYRLEPQIGANARAKDEVAKWLEVCREGRFLEGQLQLGRQQIPPTYNYDLPVNAWDAIAQGNRLAEEERRRIGIGQSSISTIEDLIADQGVWTATATLPDAMSGFFLRHPDVGAAIIVNKHHVIARRRFSFAHEYAHALVDRDRTISISSQDNASELIEKRANAFAAAFLMPPDGVQDFLAALDKDRGSRDIGAVYNIAGDAPLEFGTRPKSAHPITPQDVAFMAHHFGVSYQASVFRMRSLRVLAPAEAEDLVSAERVEEGRSYLRLFASSDEEPRSREEDDNRELKIQVTYLALEAYRRELISLGKLREIARMVGVDSASIMKAAGSAHTE